MMGPLGVLVLYRFTQDGVEKWASKRNGLTHTFSVLIMHMQAVALVHLFNVDFPRIIDEGWSAPDLFVEGLAFLRVDCAGLSTVTLSFLTNMLTPVLAGCLFLTAFFLARLVSRFVSFSFFKVNGNILFNSYASIMYTFSVGVAALSFSLFNCFPHPNGESSMKSRPSVLCGSDEWNSLVGIAVVGILAYCVAPLSFTGWILQRAPREFHSLVFQQRWKFLIAKFRPNVWWWGQVVVTRGIFMNLGLVALNFGLGQVMWVICCMLPYMVGLVCLRPWRHFSSYSTDLASAVLLSITVSLMAYFADPEPDRESDYAAIILGFSFLPGFVFLYYVITVGFGVVQSHRGRNDSQADLAFSYQLKGMLSVIGGATPEPFARFVSRLADTEMDSLRSVHDLILLQFFGLQAHTEWWKQSISLSAGIQESGVRWRNTTFDGIAATSPAGAIKDKESSPEDAEANTRDTLTKRLCGMRAMREPDIDVTDFPDAESIQGQEQDIPDRRVLDDDEELALGPV